MTTIDAATLKARLDAGEQLNLIDVREPAEHAEFNIGGQLVRSDRSRACNWMPSKT